MKLFLWLSEHGGQLVDALTAIISGASLLAALTPTPKDDTFLGKLYKLIDWLALNIGHAKDKGEK
jgi:hypothetical protein